ncbi:MAG: MFS transporter [bacterium]|nr:MFS transporter [bacterium]
MLYRRLMLGTVLAVAMAAATFAPTVFGVLASDLISFLRIERWQLGLLVSGATLCGAVFSLLLGKWADMVGGRRATILTLLIAGVALVGVGAAPGFGVMMVAACLAGIASGLSNPATNRLISEEFATGSQSLIVGVKQSGVQIGVFLGGWLLPVFTMWWDWRWAVVAFAAVPLVFAGLYTATASRVHAGREDTAGEPFSRIPRMIYRLAVYGFIMGTGMSVVLAYLPLYAEEVMGMSQGQAGLALAVTGLVGILARLGWARVAEGRFGSVRSLRTIALLAVAMGLVLAFGHQLGSWTIWLAAALTGLSGSAWNAVGMLAIIQILPTSLAGRGSGVVLLGFLTGLGLGAPVVGLSVDLLGVYTPGWLAITVLFGLGFWVMNTGRRRVG